MKIIYVINQEFSDATKYNSIVTAVAQLQDLSPEFKVDLVELEHCQESLREAILAEGRFL